MVPKRRMPTGCGLRPTRRRAFKLSEQATDSVMRRSERTIMNEATHDYIRTTVYIAPFTALIPPNNVRNLDPEAPATAAGLLGCGVMAGFGAAVQHRQRRPRRQASRSSAAAGSATRRSPAPGIAGATDGHRRRRRRPQARVGTGGSAPPTRSTAATRTPCRGDPRADRRVRCRRGVEAVGRPETTAGVLRARPRRTVVLVGVPTPDLKRRAAMIEISAVAAR